MAELENYEGSSKRSQEGEEYVYDPVNGKYVLVVDATQKIKEITEKTPPSEKEVNAFYHKRMGMIQVSSHLNDEEKKQRIANIKKLVKRQKAPKEDYKDPPPPGGVGFGVFYKSGELSFIRSAKLHHHIICPQTVGGDNTDYLYLTATNRTAKGVEAFVLYFAQEAARFRVYDWARPDGERFQVVIENAQLQPYLGTLSGRPYIGVINSTDLLQGTTWRNSVLLFNNNTNNYDEIYRFDYTLGSNAEQHDSFFGSWAPIVETFQASYGPELNPMGCFYTYIFLDDAVNTLYDSNTTLRNDNVGIEAFNLQHNHSYLVH